MRIVSGTFGGRTIDSPRGHKTHPMSDKMRGALFNVLGDIEGLTVLDAFSGTGAIGLEAISRGSGHVISVELDKDAHKIIESNARSLQIKEGLKAVRASISGWSENNPDKKFDLVICDPPYDKLQQASLSKAVQHINDNGVFVLSWPKDEVIPEFADFSVVVHKSYGDGQLLFYKHV